MRGLPRCVRGTEGTIAKFRTPAGCGAFRAAKPALDKRERPSFDATLPDIDLLVILVEPTLGYVIFVCELKCPVQPRRAQNQLKVLNKDSVSKAFRQIEALRRFIRTAEGLRFLSKMLPEEGHPHFEGFVVVLQHIVVTSDNAGMFFGAESTEVINFRTRLLYRSDGDMLLIQNSLKPYAEQAGQALVTSKVEFHQRS